MAKKRKSRTAEPPQEPDVAAVQPTEPEPEQPEPEETQQIILEQNPEPAQNDFAVGGEEEPEEEEEDDEATEKPINEAVSENGAVEGDELELEEEEEEEPLEKLLEPFSKDQLALIIREAVAKHREVIESVHRLADADPAHCKIFVHGLGWDASVETITSVFGQYGEIEDCKVVKDKKTGKSKGYGFILYKHRSGARRALKQPQKLIEGRMASCQLASAGPVQAPSQAAVMGSASTPPASEHMQRKIYVSNVSAAIDPRKLLEFFAKFGEIEEGPLGLDKQTGKPRGFCLFVYRSVDSARKALQEPDKNFEGQVLHCQKAVDGPKHSKGLINHHQQQQQQGYYHHAVKKGRYAGGVGHSGGHLMTPTTAAAPHMPPAGFNAAVAPAALGQAVAALLATQGAGLGIGNFSGGMGAGVNQQGVPPMMSNVGYGGQGGYGGQPGMQGGYGGQPQMGQGGVRPHQGGAPYMGHGH